MKKIIYSLVALAVAGFTSCSDNDEPNNGGNQQHEDAEGLFVVCNGGFYSSDASLSYYDLEHETVENEVFWRANGMKLGSIAQSMTIDGDLGWVVVNNSNVIFAIDTDTYKEVGRVDAGLISPRYIAFVGKDKAYVSQMYSSQIAVVNTKTFTVTGYIDVPGMENVWDSVGDTEEMIVDGGYCYVNCWSYQKNVAKIDLATDKVVDTLEVGIQPRSMVFDGDHTLWVLCDGGAWEQNPVGYVAPTIVSLDLKKFEIVDTYTLELGQSVSSLNYYNGDLYWLCNGVQRVKAGKDGKISGTPTTVYETTSFGLNALTINPDNGDLYIADAVDYQQNGVVIKVEAKGGATTSFGVGLIPAGFCWDLD